MSSTVTVAVSLLASSKKRRRSLLLPLGGPNLDQQGLRSTPTTHYLVANAAFRFESNEPFGGFPWDDRADSLADQAGGPFFESAEMAQCKLVRELSVHLQGGRQCQRHSDIQCHQASDRFNSKFDRMQDGQASLSAQELRGLSLFNEPTKGNCAACHTSANQADGGKPLFTNFGYAALAVPRNTSTRTTNDPTFFDLGLCGPNRKDLAARTDLCGKFKTPTLRNIELTAPYFHNAAINDLTDAVRFHVTRDTDAARWYPAVNVVVQRYNDVPAQYQANITRVAPFDRQAGDAAALNDSEIADVVAFLKTLTDVIPAQ